MEDSTGGSDRKEKIRRGGVKEIVMYNSSQARVDCQVTH